MDNTTAALARMNMILHDNPTAEIWQDNTLSSPYWKNPNGSLKTFDVDASQGFMKDGAKNRLRHQDIRKIVDVFNGQIELPRYSRIVALTEIQANDYNLNLPRYIDTTDPEDIQDIGAHLFGGIPDRDLDALSRTWAVFPALHSARFAPRSAAGSDPTPYALGLQRPPATVAEARPD